MTESSKSDLGALGVLGGCLSGPAFIGVHRRLVFFRSALGALGVLGGSIMSGLGVLCIICTTIMQQRRFRDDVSNSRLCPEAVYFQSVAACGAF